jgi:hypothetical protein
MASSAMLRRVALVRTDVSEELSASFIRVIMNNAVFWDVKAEIVPHRKHITSLLQSPAS